MKEGKAAYLNRPAGKNPRGILPLFSRFLRGREGFTVVELITTLAVAMIITMAAYSSFIFSKQSYEVHDETVAIQQDARIALATIEQDIRQAGSVRDFPPHMAFNFGDNIEGVLDPPADTLAIFGIQRVGRFNPDESDPPGYCYLRINALPIEAFNVSGTSGQMLINVKNAGIGCPGCDCREGTLRDPQRIKDTIPVKRMEGGKELPGTHFLIDAPGRPNPDGTTPCGIIEATALEYPSSVVPDIDGTAIDFALVSFDLLAPDSPFIDFCWNNNAIVNDVQNFFIGVGEKAMSGSLYVFGGNAGNPPNCFIYAYGEVDRLDPGNPTMANAFYEISQETRPLGSGNVYSLLKRNDKETLLNGAEDFQVAFMGKTGDQYWNTWACGPDDPLQPCDLTRADLYNTRAVRVSMVVTEEDKHVLLRDGVGVGARNARKRTPRINIENRQWPNSVAQSDPYFVRRVFSTTVYRRNSDLF